MRLYIIRHAQSQHNEWFLKKLRTPSMWFTHDSQITDARLSSKGLTQAQILQETLNSLPIDLIISSPLTRAIQTMQISTASRSVPVIITPLVRERCDRLADTGQELAKLKKAYPSYEFLHFNNEEWWKKKDGMGFEREINASVNSRVDEFKNFLRTRKEKHIAVFAHGIFIMTFLNKWTMSANCEVVSVELNMI